MILAALMPYKWAAIGLAVVGACAWSGWQGYTSGRDRVQAMWDQSILEANQAARAAEQANNFRAGAIRDDLTKARLDADRATVLAGQRLRQLGEVQRAGNASFAACRDAGAPAVAILREQTVGELVQLASDADAISARLVACQRWVTTMER